MSVSNWDSVRTAVTERIYTQNVTRTPPVPRPHPLAFAFTGQGIFTPSLGVELFRLSPHFRADTLCMDDLGRLSPTDFLASSTPSTAACQTRLPLGPAQTQLALTAVQIALVRLYKT